MGTSATIKAKSIWELKKAMKIEQPFTHKRKYKKNKKNQKRKDLNLQRVMMKLQISSLTACSEPEKVYKS